MPGPERPLLSRVASLLGLSEQKSVAREEPPPALSAKASSTMAACESLRRFAQRIFDHLDPRLELLRAACLEAGLLKGVTVPVLPTHRALIKGIVVLLTSDRGAAGTATSVVFRYDEAKQALIQLDQALAMGQLDQIDVNRLRGKFFYLSKIAFSLRDYPLLVRALSLSVPDIRAQTLARPSLSPAKTKPLSEAERLKQEAHVLLDRLEMRMLILKAALEALYPGPQETMVLLPFPAQATATQLGKILAADVGTCSRVKSVIDLYLEARGYLRRQSELIVDHGEIVRIRTVLSSLSALPQHFKGHGVLAKIFPAA